MQFQTHEKGKKKKKKRQEKVSRRLTWLMRASGQTPSHTAMSLKIFPTSSPILLVGYQKRRLCMDSYHQPIRILYKIEKKVVPTHDTSNTLISYGTTDIREQRNPCCFLSTAASNQQTLVSGLRNAIGKK